jgi:hypothetical protein
VIPVAISAGLVAPPDCREAFIRILTRFSINSHAVPFILKPGWDFQRASAQLAAISPALMQATMPPEYNSSHLLAHGFLKAWQCRGLQYDCGSEQTSWTHPERHQAGEDAVRRA